ncbi:TRAF protein-interacting protein-like protein [Aphelenchoides avenae]|nr:TRAF protein-interacting protein-like protein [Aphelenchus avenae]
MNVGRCRAQCSICYEALHPDTTSALLCGHTFHEACITKWLGDYKKRTCPRCGLQCDKDHLIRVRYDVPDDMDEPEDVSEAVEQCKVIRLATLKKWRFDEPQEWHDNSVP